MPDNPLMNRDVDTTVEPTDSIRVKLGTNCQMSCNFCHQEGNHDASDANEDEILDAIEVLRDRMGIAEVHYTGGEPTLYRGIEDLIAMTKDRGLRVSMTSNCTYSRKKLTRVIDAGLDSLNASVHHTLDPKAWLRMQGYDASDPSRIKWANRALSRVVRNIDRSRDRIETKVNTVVSDNESHVEDVFNYCKMNDIRLRLLNDLTMGQESLDRVFDIVERFDGDLIHHEVEAVSSSHKFEYRTPDGFRFDVKAIRDFYLDSMCDSCDKKGTDDCVERVYGIRLESDPLHVRLCLHRDGEPYVQPFDEFLDSPQYNEMMKLNGNA